MTDRLTADQISEKLTTVWAGHPLYFQDVVASTNETAQLLADNGAAHGTLVVAETQTSGKGRRGRSWHSPEGSGIWMSILLKPQVHPEKASMVTLVAAMAVYDALSSRVSECRIKWPNDIVIQGKKVCGILTTMQAEPDQIKYVITGIGINVNTDYFPEDIADVAASMYTVSGRCFTRSAIIADVMAAFEKYYAQWIKTEDLSLLKNLYNERLINCGRTVYIEKNGVKDEGIAEGIDDSGCLIVKTPDGGRTHIMSGEVSVRGVLGYV